VKRLALKKKEKDGIGKLGLVGVKKTQIGTRERDWDWNSKEESSKKRKR